MNQANEDNEVKDWLIIDTRSVVGNCVMFWAENSQGYTCELEKAGRYTKSEAERIQNSRGTDVAVPVLVAAKYAVTHVRQDSLRQEWNLSPERPKRSKR